MKVTFEEVLRCAACNEVLTEDQIYFENKNCPYCGKVSLHLVQYYTESWKKTRTTPWYNVWSPEITWELIDSTKGR